MKKVVALVAASVVTISCASFTKVKEAAEISVGYFHRQLNSERYAEIYRQSDQKFHDAVKENDSTALLEAVHRKLGNVKDATLTAWRVDTIPEGTFISMAYNTKFTEGDGVEQFRFLVNGEETSLVNYNINSPLLIIK